MDEIEVNFLEVIDLVDEPETESLGFEIKKTKLHPGVVVRIGSRQLAVDKH